MATQILPPPKNEKKLLDQYLDAIKVKQYSSRTGETYMQWVREYILYHNKRHPKEMAEPEINQFITHLVGERKVSASTHTALAFGARGIRRSAPSCFYIAMSFILDWMKHASPNFARSAPKASPPYYPKPKSSVSSILCKGQTN